MKSTAKIRPGDPDPQGWPPKSAKGSKASLTRQQQAGSKNTSSIRKAVKAYSMANMYSGGKISY